MTQAKPTPAMRPLEWWLPPLSRFDANHPLRRWLLRSDVLAAGPIGDLDGLASWFSSDVKPLAIAAITRDATAGDAGDQMWLCADPAFAQADLNGVRLLGCGRMQLDMEQAQALGRPLKPVFGDAGMLLEITTPDHWHLRLPAGSPLPVFDTPDQALGEDLLQHLPQGPDGRRWRALFNEVQVVLHQQPLNRQRVARGLAPVNCLWLWGGGRLPRTVSSELSGVVGDDPLLVALAVRAHLARLPRDPTHVATARAGWLIDVRDVPADDLASEWWPVLESLARKLPVTLSFVSGERWLRRPWHRWRVWRGTGA